MKRALLFVLLVVTGGITGRVSAQETQEVPAYLLTGSDIMGTIPAEEFQFNSDRADLGYFQRSLIDTLHREFPRLPGLFTSVHSFRLPDYGPLIFINVQPPAVYFTRPVLQQLEAHQHMAEEQAEMIRKQLDRASQYVRLKAKEADLLQQIDLQMGSKKGKKDVAPLQKDLDDVRKNLQSMEAPTDSSITISMNSIDVDLDKMLSKNYQDLIDRLTIVLKDTLAETAPYLSDLKENEKVCINAHIRQGLMGNADQSILIVLAKSDIEAFRKQQIDLAALKEKITITRETEP